jgi:hypothetical protein
MCIWGKGEEEQNKRGQKRRRSSHQTLTTPLWRLGNTKNKFIRTSGMASTLSEIATGMAVRVLLLHRLMLRLLLLFMATMLCSCVCIAKTKIAEPPCICMQRRFELSRARATHILDLPCTSLWLCGSRRNALASANAQGQRRLLSAGGAQGDDKAEDATLALQNRCQRQAGTNGVFLVFLECFWARAFFS